MTVIAWDGKTLAADRLLVFNGLKLKCRKIFRIGSMLVGAAGDSPLTEEFIEYIRGSGDYPTSTGDFEGIVINRVANIYTTSKVPLVVDGPIAIGVGAVVAMTVMSLGGSAIDAVKQCNKTVEGCGMGIDYLEL